MSYDVDLSAVQDTLTVEVGPQQVVLRRTAPFTATEHARAVAFAEVAAELVGPGTGRRRGGPHRADAVDRRARRSGSPPSTTPAR